MTLRKKISELIKTIKELKQQSGSVLIISAMLLPLMLGCLGFAYDFGNLYIHKTRLQNIVDAAALAGGYAFLESQSNPDERLRDKVDALPSASEGLTGEGRDPVVYEVGGSRDPSGIHQNADGAADDYIYKNIVNLGTTVSSDEFSHYALKTDGANPRVFYRIGLYEEVPLYFLSVLINKKEQRVRAGAIALVDDGKGFSHGKTVFDNLFTVSDGINVGEGIAVDSTGAAIQATFDGDIVVATEKSKWGSVQKGDYFYTQAEKKFLSDNQENLTISDMTAKNPNTGGKAVLWNTSQDLEGIDSEVSGFLNKLAGPHVDLKKNCNVLLISNLNNAIKTVDMDSYKSKDQQISNHYSISKTEGKVTYVTDYFNKQEAIVKDDKNTWSYKLTRYVSCIPRGASYNLSVEELDKFSSEGVNSDLSPGKAYELYENENDYYYRFYTEGKQFKNSFSTFKPECFTYIVDSEGHKIFCLRKYNTYPYFDFYRKKWLPGSKEYQYWQINRKDSYNQVKGNTTYQNTYLISREVKLNENKITYTYHEMNDGQAPPKSFDMPIIKMEDMLLSEGFDLSNARRVNEYQINDTNVYHLEQDGWESNDVNETKEMKFEVNGLDGEEYFPMYIIITGNRGRKIKINVTKSNQRPIIFCNLTTNMISEFTINDGETFKGMIYSPYAKVVNVAGVTVGNNGTTKGHFVGSIAAKELELQKASEQEIATTWTHQNFLENDSDLNTISEEAAKAQAKRKQDAIQQAKNIFTAKYPGLGISENWDTPSWFSSQVENQNAIKSAWNEVRKDLLKDFGLDMPDWPWSEGGKQTDKNKHHYSLNDSDSGPAGKKVRIINFRTEYTKEPYINPFNNLYLKEK